METLPIGKSDLTGSRLVYGCMRLVGDGVEPQHRSECPVGLDPAFLIQAGRP